MIVLNLDSSTCWTGYFFYSNTSVCVCEYMRVCASMCWYTCVHVHVCSFTRRPEDSVECCFSGTIHCFFWSISYWLGSARDLSVSTSPALRLRVCATMPVFVSVGSGDQTHELVFAPVKRFTDRTLRYHGNCKSGEPLLIKMLKTTGT